MKTSKYGSLDNDAIKDVWWIVSSNVLFIQMARLDGPEYWR